MYQQRIAHLEEAHRSLDRQIEKLQQSGVYEDHTLNELKKKKLKCRDEISRLRKLDWEETHERVNLDDER